MTYTGTSIVDYLKSVGQASDYSSRTALAKQYGITNYSGSAEQNTQLLNTLRTKASTPAPAPTPAPVPSSTPTTPASTPTQPTPATDPATGQPTAPAPTTPTATNDNLPPAPTPVVATPDQPTATTPDPTATTPLIPTPGQSTATGGSTGTTYQGSSIVDYLKSVGQGSDFGSRTQLAKQYGIANYSGSAQQNTQLLNAIRSGSKTAGSSPASSAMAGMDSGSGSSTTPTDGSTPTTDTKIADPIQTILDKFGITLPTDLQSPVTSFADTYKQIYESMGLSTIKDQYEADTKLYADLQNEKGDEILKINNDPWLTEGVRVRQLRKLDDKYQSREAVLLDKIKLSETMYDAGRQDAQFVAGKTLDTLQNKQSFDQDIILKAIDMAETATKAQNAIALKQTVPGKAPSVKSSTPKKVTLADQKTGIQSFLKTGISPGGEKIGNGRGADGYVDPSVYIRAFQEWGGTAKDFLTYFPVKGNVNPASYKLLPEAIRPTSSRSI